MFDKYLPRNCEASIRMSKIMLLQYHENAQLMPLFESLVRRLLAEPRIGSFGPRTQPQILEHSVMNRKIDRPRLDGLLRRLS